MILGIVVNEKEYVKALISKKMALFSDMKHKGHRLSARRPLLPVKGEM
jgi:hypothetical protein